MDVHQDPSHSLELQSSNCRVKNHFSLCTCGDWHQLQDWLVATSMRPDLCRKRPLVSCTVNASTTATSAATVDSALPRNPLASPVNTSCTGVQWLTRQFQQSRHVDIRVVRLSKAIERVSCAHCQRDPQSCTMCLKCRDRVLVRCVHTLDCPE